MKVYGTCDLDFNHKRDFCDPFTYPASPPHYLAFSLVKSRYSSLSPFQWLIYTLPLILLVLTTVTKTINIQQTYTLLNLFLLNILLQVLPARMTTMILHQVLLNLQTNQRQNQNLRQRFSQNFTRK
jgi:hypothetical protein